MNDIVAHLKRALESLPPKPKENALFSMQDAHSILKQLKAGGWRIQRARARERKLCYWIAYYPAPETWMYPVTINLYPASFGDIQPGTMYMFDVADLRIGNQQPAPDDDAAGGQHVER